MKRDCTAEGTDLISPREAAWRAICNSVLPSHPRSTPVNFVGVGLEEELAWANENMSEGQGNAMGLPA